MQTRLITLIIAILIVGAGAFYLLQKPAMAPENSTQNSDMLNGEAKYEILTEDAKYFGDSNGFYAHPTAEGSYPGVVMIHEWWGLNDNIKDMARQLAGQGYNVLAVDLYGEVAATPDRARELVSSINQETANQNLQAAAGFLRSKGANKIASLGWCFGGGQSLQLALSGEELDATVIYYGQLVTDQQRLASIDWPILGIFGDQDTSIPVENVNAFENALNANSIDNSIHIYPGVGHAFANPSGANYAPEETRDAWNKTLEFLNAHLR